MDAAGLIVLWLLGGVHLNGAEALALVVLRWGIVAGADNLAVFDDNRAAFSAQAGGFDCRLCGGFEEGLDGSVGAGGEAVHKASIACTAYVE